MTVLLTDRPVRARVVLARQLWGLARGALRSARALRRTEPLAAARCVQEARRMVRLARRFDRDQGGA